MHSFIYFVVWAVSMVSYLIGSSGFTCAYTLLNQNDGVFYDKLKKGKIDLPTQEMKPRPPGFLTLST